MPYEGDEHVFSLCGADVAAASAKEKAPSNRITARVWLTLGQMIRLRTVLGSFSVPEGDPAPLARLKVVSVILLYIAGFYCAVTVNFL